MNVFNDVTKVIAQRDPHRFMVDDVLIFVTRVEDSPNGRKVSYPAPLTLVEAKEGEYRQPTLMLRADEAQRLMDSLWDIGVRPAANSSAGQLEQAEKHLSDLRIIAFHALKVPGSMTSPAQQRPNR